MITGTEEPLQLEKLNENDRVRYYMRLAKRYAKRFGNVGDCDADDLVS